MTAPPPPPHYRRPHLCVSLSHSTAHVLSCLDALDPRFEMCEVRVDLLSDFKDAPAVFAAAKSRSIPTIATVRELPNEPKGSFSPERRALLEQCVRAGATFVDVEVESPADYSASVVRVAKACGCAVVVSHHDYDKTEKASFELKGVVADVAKVAVARGAAARVTSHYDDDGPVVAFGMGERWRFDGID